LNVFSNVARGKLEQEFLYTQLKKYLLSFRAACPELVFAICGLALAQLLMLKVFSPLFKKTAYDYTQVSGYLI
jgi:hypothetical protein